MGWRIRKTFSPLPGVRLTLSPRGISTSVGVGPLRLTAGTQGPALTARIPGTGIAYRQSLAVHPPRTGARPAPVAPAAVEIRSAGADELQSPGLGAFHEVLAQCRDQRRALLPDLAAAAAEVDLLERAVTSWERGWFRKKVFPGRFARLQDRRTATSARRDELRAQERALRVRTHIDIAAGVRESYGRLREAFTTLAASRGIWDAVARTPTDRVRGRTTAAESIARRPVKFDLASCDLVETEWQAPHLQNANGGDLYLYPGFVLVLVSLDVFALIEARDVRIEIGEEDLVEDGPLPPDTRVVRQAWRKSNLDGSPDRRFAANEQLPVAQYGRISLRSGAGLNEQYIVSSYASAVAFGEEWNAFLSALATQPARTEEP